ncbi:MAG: UDP-3-O-(3-hydroxymyristoyl)glucosamine N-acyltransferase [Planctomycetota bacterium]
MPDEHGLTESEAQALTAGSLAESVGGVVAEGDASVSITGLSGLMGARPGDVSFVASRKYAREAADSAASALLAPEGLELSPGCKPAALIRVRDIEDALERAAELLAPPPPPRPEGIHPSAIIGRNVVMGENVAVGPCAVIEEDARVGDNATVGAQAFIGRGAIVGSNTRLSPGVVIGYGCELGSNVILHSGVVIGGDGFGFTFKDGRHEKIPQAGKVVIGDDVEIGSNTTVDRARFGATRIGRGTKIDDLVMIAHNVQIGEHCIIVAQSGIAGSTVVGDYVMLGARAGVTGHVRIGARAQVGGRAGVTKDVPADAKMLGFPAGPYERVRRQWIAVRKLPELIQTVRELEQKVARLCETGESEETSKDN